MRDQIANVCWIIEKTREVQKNICFIDYAKTFHSGSQQTGKFLKMGIQHHLICLLRNLYAGQGATVRTGYRTTDWFQIGKGVHQGYILLPCLFNLYAEYTRAHQAPPSLGFSRKEHWSGLPFPSPMHEIET